MEKALYATSTKMMDGAAGMYSRVYFGAEFCQWRLPSPDTVMKAWSRAFEAGLAFTLLTPWVTDEGLARVRRILAELDRAGAKAEVVVNDLGVLSVLRAEFPPRFTPVLGRLLVKQKRCPRVPGIMDDLPEAGREVFLRSNVEDPVTVAFLRKFGVRRVELDNPLQGLSVKLGGRSGFKGSIYSPYAYVTTTRHCPASFDGSGWQAFGGCALKGCAGTIIKLKHPAHEAGLVMRGNTQFVENPVLPEGLENMGVDRIVFMREVP